MNCEIELELSDELIEAIERLAPMASVSEFLETAAWEVTKRLNREAADARDAAIYAEYADELNAEALESMDFQIDFESLVD